MSALIPRLVRTDQRRISSEARFGGMANDTPATRGDTDSPPGTDALTADARHVQGTSQGQEATVARAKTIPAPSGVAGGQAHQVTGGGRRAHGINPG